MASIVRIGTLALFLAQIAFVGCGGNSTGEKDPKSSAGDSSAGDSSAGDSSAGDSSAGDSSAGDSSAGEGGKAATTEGGSAGQSEAGEVGSEEVGGKTTTEAGGSTGTGGRVGVGGSGVGGAQGLGGRTGSGGSGVGGAQGLGGRIGSGGSGAGESQGLGGRIGSGGSGAAGATDLGGRPGAGGAGLGGVAEVGGGTGVGGSEATCSLPNPILADPGPGACEDFAPCGGDPTGVWTIEAICIDPPISPFASLCPDSPNTTDSLELTGTMTYGADGSYAAAATLHTTGHIGADCVSSLGLDCEDVIDGCVPASDGGCDCDYSTTLDSATSYTWAAEGNHLFLFQPDCTTETAYYCATGNVLQLRGGTADQLFTYSLSRR